MKLKCVVLSIVLLTQQSLFSQFQLEPPEPVGPREIQTDILAVYENVEASKLSRCSNIIHPSLLFRAGILERVELQLNIQLCTEYVRRNNDVSASIYERTVTGMIPVKGGLKFLMNEGEKLIPAAALLVNISVPQLASKYYRSSYPAPEFIISAASEIKNFSIGCNAGLLWDGENTDPYEFYIFSLSYAPIKYLALFAESYAYYKSKTPADSRIDAGISFLISDNLQLDLAAGFGLSDSSPANFFGAGIYIVFPEL